MAQKPEDFFGLSDSEYSCAEMVFTFFTILESRGYPGFSELASVLGKPEILIKVLRLMSGMQIQIPPLEEFVNCLRTAIYVFIIMNKTKCSGHFISNENIRDFLSINEEQEQDLNKIFEEWAVYMNQQGHDIRNYFNINSKTTVRHIKRAVKGKKFKQVSRKPSKRTRSK